MFYARMSTHRADRSVLSQNVGTPSQQSMVSAHNLYHKLQLNHAPGQIGTFSWCMPEQLETPAQSGWEPTAGASTFNVVGKTMGGVYMY